MSEGQASRSSETGSGETWLAIFVGGRSSRMGGAPKGLLAAPDTGEPIVEKLVRVGREASLLPVLVGDAAPYVKLAPGAPRLADEPPGIGPLGGLSAVLGRAGSRRVITVACDMPHVDAEVLALLRDHPSTAAALAPRRGPDAPFEPLLARYDAARVAPVLARLLASGGRSFQALMRALDAEALDLEPSLARALVDWDAPGDVE